MMILVNKVARFPYESRPAELAKSRCWVHYRLMTGGTLLKKPFTAYNAEYLIPGKFRKIAARWAELISLFGY